MAAQSTKYLCGLLCAVLIFLSANVLAQDFPPQNSVSLAVPLYLEGLEVGTVQMFIAPNPQDSYVQTAPIIASLKNHIAEDKLRTLESLSTKGFLNLTDAQKSGINISFDENLIAISISLAPEIKKQQSLSVRGLYDVSNKTITEPAALSAYVNMFGSQDYVEEGASTTNGRQPVHLSSDGAINLHGAVLEGSGNYIEDANHPFQRGDTRLVYDAPDKMVRVAAGDLSYPVEGFQSFQSMAGITIARDFDLQPYRVSEPTGQTSFFLNSPSRVEIYVNDRKVQTLQLASGPFDVRNFPVVNGSNDVRLVITDSSGRQEVKTFSIVSDANLLEDGLHKYAYNLGVISNTNDGVKNYDGSKPVLSAFHLYGLTDWLTIGANLQADSDQQMGGVDGTIGGKWGIFRADVSQSTIQNGADGTAVQGQYQYINPAKITNDGSFKGASNFTMLTTYRDKNFAPLGTLLPNNLFSYDTTARYSQQISPTLNLGIGGRYEIGRDGQSNQWTTSTSLSKQLGNGFNMSVNMEHTNTESFGVFLNFTWTPKASRQFVSASYDSTTHTTRTDWNYASAQRTNSIAASAGIVHNSAHDEGQGSLTYYGNRGDVSASHDLVTSSDSNGTIGGTQERSNMRFGTALAMSDGHFAISRPIAGSFAIVAPDPSISKYPIGVNPQRSDSDDVSYEAKTGALGSAVLPELTPYMYRTLRVDTASLPPGYDPGDTNYTLHPSYHSGTFIKIGSNANVLLDGTLVYENGNPVALQAGTIHPASGSGADSETFFTNRQGRFRIEKLKAGDYIAELYSFPGLNIKLNIPEGAAGPTQAGILTLPAMPENTRTHSGKWDTKPASPERAVMQEPLPFNDEEIQPKKIYPAMPKQGGAK